MNSNDKANQRADRGGQFLTCRVADEQYGIEVLKVREIIGVLPVTPLPHSHEHVLGVINLRGRVIAVADLRTRFGMPYREPTEESCIIVVEIDDGEESQTTGILVDEVADVCHVEEDQTIDPPQFDDRVDSSCLLGLGRADGRVIFLLDIAQVLRGQRPTAATELGLPPQEQPQTTP